MREAGAHPK